MGWYDIGDGLLGGDAPLDAYGGAARRIAKRWKKELGRLPTLAEMLTGFDAPAGESATLDALERATREPEPPRTAARKLETGDLLSIPYAEGEAVVGLVLFGEDRREKGPGLGPCVVPLDLPPDAIADLDRVRTARWLTKPFHPGLRWRVGHAGRVRLEPDAAFLPTFAWHVRPNGGGGWSSIAAPGWARRIFDYFGRDVTEDPAASARVVEAVVGGTDLAIVSIRAARGLHRELPGSRIALSAETETTPLTSLPPFEAMPAKKRPKPRAKDRGPPSAALTALLADELRSAREECDDAWRDAVERPPAREELASALGLVLAASAEDFLSDPGRAERAERPRRTPTTPRNATEPRITVGTMHGAEQIRIEGDPGGVWTAYVFRENGHLVVETFCAGENGGRRVPEVLAVWRAHHGLPQTAEDVVWRPMEWGHPRRLHA